MIHQSHSWAYIWRKSQFEKIHAPQCSLQHYLRKLGCGKWKKVKAKSLSHIQLCDPMDCSLPGFSIHGIFQARVPEWVAISFSGDLSDPGIKPGSPTLQADALPSKPPGKHQDMEATYMSSDRRLDKDVVHIYNGILLSHGKEWNNAICSDMDEPRECHTKWSKSDRESQVSHDIAYLQNLKKWYKWTYLQNRSWVTDVENKFVVTRGKRWGEQKG